MFYIFMIFLLPFSALVFNNPIFDKNSLNPARGDEELTEFKNRSGLGMFVLVMVAILLEWFSVWQRVILIALAVYSTLCAFNYIYEKKGLFGLFVGIVMFATPFVAWNYQWILLFLSVISKINLVNLGTVVSVFVIDFVIGAVIIYGIVRILIFTYESISNATFESNNPTGSFGEYMTQLTLVFLGLLLLIGFFVSNPR